MSQETRLCIVCGVKKASPRRLKCSSCKNIHLKDVQRTCIDCQERLAAPGRKICWNCKLLRNLMKHPENVESTNERRRHRYKTNTNGYRTKNLQRLENYRENHREKACETSQEWREKYPERQMANNRRWREENLEYIRQKSREYDALHPEKTRFWSQMRKARMRNASIGIFTDELWQEQLEYFGNCCAYCLVPLDVVTLEHITPISRGGLHDISNAVPACSTCNSRKNDKNLLEWVLYVQGIYCAAIGNARPRRGRPRKQLAG